MNNENLRHFTSNQSREEAVKNGRLGGIASGESRRTKKAIVELLHDFLDCDATDETSRELLSEFNQEYGTHTAVLVIRLFKSALDGDTRAIRTILEVTGELSKCKVNVAVNNVEESEAYRRGYDKAMNDILAMLPEDVLRKLVSGEYERHEKTPPELASIVGLTYSR